MKKVTLWIALFLPLLIIGQQNAKGVEFIQGLSWEEIKTKSIAENKYIFIDAYTTWCLPCKKMDVEVFSNDTVGRYINTNFIAVKVQVDSTKKDNEQIKRWYPDARAISKQYNVSEFPSFLFFTPNGLLVHKGLGYHSVAGFIRLAEEARNAQNIIYYNKLQEYKEGKKDFATLYELARYASSLRDPIAKQIAAEYVDRAGIEELITKEKIEFVLEVAQNFKLLKIIASEYKKRYLDTLNEKSLFTYDTLRFIDRFFKLYISSEDKIFRLCYAYPNKMDSIIGDQGWSKRVTEYVIKKEELADKLLKDGKPVFGNPDWSGVKLKIQKKYPIVPAEVLVLDFKIRYYKLLKSWPEYTRHVIDRVENYGPYDPISNVPEDYKLNNNAWEIFQYSMDSKELKTALSWSDQALASCSNPDWKANWMDTKANILYKLGKTKQAIRLQQEALDMDPSNQQFVNNLNKMKKGEKTWPAEN